MAGVDPTSIQGRIIERYSGKELLDQLSAYHDDPQGYVLPAEPKRRRPSDMTFSVDEANAPGANPAPTESAKPEQRYTWKEWEQATRAPGVSPNKPDMAFTLDEANPPTPGRGAPQGIEPTSPAVSTSIGQPSVTPRTANPIGLDFPGVSPDRAIPEPPNSQPPEPPASAGPAYAPPAPAAPQPATAGVAPTSAAGPSDLNQRMMEVNALGAMSQGGGGGPNITETTTRAQKVFASPEEAKAAADANERAKAAHADVAAAILNASKVGAERGAYDAAQQRGMADVWDAKARDAEVERAQLQQDLQNRMAQANDARTRFLDATRDAPLGTALNPDGAQRVMGGIGLALGGALQGFRGGPNPALQIITTAIDTDLKRRQERLMEGKADLDATDAAFRASANALGQWGAAQAHMRATLLEGVKLRGTALATQTGSMQAEANMKLLGAQFAASQADADSESAMRVAADRQTKMVRHSGGGGEDPLKHAMRLEQFRKLVLDNEGTLGKLTGPGRGVDPLRMRMMYDRMDRGKFLDFEAAERDTKEAMRTGGGVPNMVLRALNDAIDRNSAKGGTVATMVGGLEGVVRNLNFTEAQRVQANHFVRTLNAYIYASSGKQINETEATRLKRALGLSANSTAAEVVSGMNEMNAAMAAKRKALRQMDPQAYDAITANAFTPDKPADADGFDPSRAPAPGQ